MTDLFYGTSGPHDAPIVLIGESWGADEARAKKPFVGSSGYELDRMLSTAGINRHDILCTNVIAAQPQGNETWRFFNPRISHSGARVRGLSPSDLVTQDLQRTYQQIAYFPRKLVIAAGNYALWATSGCTGSEIIRESNNRPVPKELQTWGPTGIMNWRGSMLYYEPIPSLAQPLVGLPLLPIIHPAAILRAWYLRDVTIQDLKKRVPQALHTGWSYASTTLAPPTFDETISYLKKWLNDPHPVLAVDIETAKGLITCLGIADSANFAVSIPFVKLTPSQSLDSYWTPEQEATIVHLLRMLFKYPHLKLVGQNFIYDTQYIQRWLGVTPHLWFDTMLAQNVIFPGTPKDLGYLSSIYCHYHRYWKDDVKEWNLKGGLDQLLRYNAVDCMRTWEIARNQEALIHHLGMEEQMQFKMDTSYLCLRMMNRGVLIDKHRRGELTFQLSDALSKLHNELLEIIPQDWIKERKKPSDAYWFTSDKQTKELFYDFLGFKVMRHRKTGNPTTGKEAIAQFKRLYPAFSGLFTRLDLAGSVENTVNVLKTPLDPDGRMRCSYNPGGTETHRLSSSENAFGRGTNLQNLSKGEEDE